MSSLKVVTKNAFANCLGFFVQIVITFIMMPFIIRHVGNEAYGAWALIIAFTGQMGILKLGFRPTINKYVSEFNAKKDNKGLNDTVNTCLFIYTISAIIILAITVFMFFNINKFFKIPIELTNVTPFIMLILGIQLALGLPAIIFGGVISGLQRYDINNGIEIVNEIIRALLIIVIFQFYPSLISLAIISFTSALLGYVLTIYFAYKICPQIKVRLFKFPDKYSLKIVFNYSLITFVIAVAGNIFMYFDKVVIGVFLNMALITFYAIAERLVTYVNHLMILVENVFAPAVSELDAKNNVEYQKRLYLYLVKVIFIAGLLIFTTFIIYGRHFIRLWLGPVYIQSVNVLIMLSVGSILLLPRYGTNAVLYGKAKHKFISYVVLVEGTISIILAILLAKRYSLTGVIIAFLLPRILIGSILYPLYTCKQLNLYLKELMIKGYSTAMIGIIPYIFISMLITSYLNPDTWTKLILLPIFPFIIYTFIVFNLGFSKLEKEKILSIGSDFIFKKLAFVKNRLQVLKMS